MKDDKLVIGGHTFDSRFILGSGKYSMKLIEAAVQDAGAQIITLAVRRANTKEQENILDYIPKNVTLLPNTSGARNAQEAIRIARLARELGCGDFVKIEIMRDSKYLLPDNQETIKATEVLAKEGFVVMPYMFPDPIAAKRLEDAGAACVMPLGAMIGSNKGLRARDFIEVIIKNSNVPVIIDAGIGRPRQAAEAEERGPGRGGGGGGSGGEARRDRPGGGGRGGAADRGVYEPGGRDPRGAAGTLDAGDAEALCVFRRVGRGSRGELFCAARRRCGAGRGGAALSAAQREAGISDRRTRPGILAGWALHRAER